jgi:hypothetical protein
MAELYEGMWRMTLTIERRHLDALVKHFRTSTRLPRQGADIAAESNA